jgi:hypothetical protein
MLMMHAADVKEGHCILPLANAQHYYIGAHRACSAAENAVKSFDSVAAHEVIAAVHH